MLGHAEEWFYRGLAGIDFDLSRPEEERLRIRPWPVGDVTQASASYKSVLGTIESKWVRTGTKFVLQVLIPPNAEATVYVPRSGAQTVTESGRDVVGRNDLKRVSEDGKYTCIRVDSGHYRFEVE
jgi:hypothetical protein